MGRGHETALKRFEAKVSECWLWKGGRNRDGYGTFWAGDWVEGKKHSPVIVLAHRWAYEHFVGPIPDGLHVLHRCDEPACVKPSHLFVGTQQQNIVDMHRKGRNPPQAGENNGNAKLSAAQIVQIRERYTGGWGEQTKLAREFGVTQATISKIVGGKAMRPPIAWPDG